MAYIGRSVDIGMFEKQVLTPNSSTTTFNLSFAVGSSNSLLVVYGGVIQEPNVAYSVSGGGQQIVFSEAPVTGTTLYIIYLGKQLTTPRTAGQETTKQSFSGDGTTTLFTLTDPPVVPSGIMVFVDGILQREGAGGNYVSSGSTINFDGAPDSGAEIDVYTLVKEKVSIDTVADGSITRAKLASSHPYWDAAGRFGIGQATSNYALDIGDVASGNMLRMSRSSTQMGGFISAGDPYFGTLSNHPFILMTNGTERGRFDADGNLILGGQQVNINEKLGVHGNQNSSLNIRVRNQNSGTSSAAAIALNCFGNTWGIECGSSNKNSNSLTFQLDYGGANLERLRLNTGGTVILNGGNTSATGVGITFPASQVASSDPNTLDDYEEGTWTPSIYGSSTSGTQTQPNPTYQVLPYGYYTKIGRYVQLTGFFSGVALSGATGNLMLGGLPFNFQAVRGTVTYLEGVTFGFATTPSGLGAPGGVVFNGSGNSAFWRPAFNTGWDNFVSASTTTYNGGGNGMHGSFTLWGIV